mmetsp:Transcript_16576/g.58066  ORF Transcript_16576/g.58066 Transcript_16576/m.58066 type:complete len:268 (+) Transcript_16576:106-909(+)
MVLDKVDLALHAQQALRGLQWHNDGAGEGPGSSSSTSAPAQEHPCGLVQRLRRSEGVAPDTLELGLKLYAFCGLPPEEARRAAKGKGDAFQEVDGLLGRGVYCSLSAEVASGQDRELLLVRFFPAGEDEDPGYCGIKVTTEPDPSGLWQEEGFAGCWQPLELSTIRDPRGELCIRASAITKATLHNPDSWLGSADRSVEVRTTSRRLAAGIPGTLQRWKFQAGLVRWTSVGFAAASMLLALLLAWFRCYGSACGALCVAFIFGVSGF